MTISISIEVPSKADFRAKVVTTDTYTASQTVSEYFIEPSEKRSFYATDTRSIQVFEVPLAGSADAPADSPRVPRHEQQDTRSRGEPRP